MEYLWEILFQMLYVEIGQFGNFQNNAEQNLNSIFTERKIKEELIF